MKCIICHVGSFPQVELMQSSQSTTRFWKGPVQYNPSHGSLLMKKHLSSEHLDDFLRYKIKLESTEGEVWEGRKKKQEMARVAINHHIVFWWLWELQKR